MTPEQESLRNMFQAYVRTSNILSLRDRWQDEKEYEDFQSYKILIANGLEKAGYEVLGITKAFKITVRKENTIMVAKVGLRSFSIELFV
jgi:hypothetical protein